jgi:predicted PurR-regulated permease PerM
MIRGRLRRHGRHEHSAAAAGAGDEYIEIDPGELRGIFSVPDWLRDVGLMAWLLVGVGVLIMGLIWILGLTQVIVAPVIAASVIAAVASPLVAWLNGHSVPRALGAVLVLLLIVAIGVGMVVVVITGITGQSSHISSELNSAKDTIAGWLKDIGLDPSKADAAKSDATKGITDSGDALLNGLEIGIEKLSSLVFFLALTALSLIFLLSDGPKIRAFVDRHMGVPRDVGQVITQRVLGSLRGYFLGVTLIAAFNAVVVTAGALILGVPLAGTIAAVTFIGAYIPYLGAWAAGGFAVLLALSGGGVDAAGGMIVVQLLANGVLQQMVQPFAMGAALGIHPLAVLIMTIAGGALFGMVGLVLAAPLTSAVVRISADLARVRAEAEAEAAREPPLSPEPAPG